MAKPKFYGKVSKNLNRLYNTTIIFQKVPYAQHLSLNFSVHKIIRKGYNIVTQCSEKERKLDINNEENEAKQRAKSINIMMAKLCFTQRYYLAFQYVLPFFL